MGLTPHRKFRLATIALSHGRMLPRPRLSPTVVALALLMLLVLPVPVGYVGGGGDDYYYVAAARCAAAHGYCLPATHWATRWPLIAPMGLVFRLFGDGHIQSMIVPFAYSVVAVVLFVRLVGQAWGDQAALAGGIAFVATASFAKGLLQPNVETIELTFVLAAVSAGVQVCRPGATHRPLWALAAGLLLAFAAQSRMTSLAWLPIIALAMPFAPANLRRLALPAVIGFALPLTIEGLIYSMATGDPLLSFHLSEAHTRIATSELPPGVDLTRSPILNPQFIAGWHPAMNIHLNWTIDGVINLLANPQMGPVLLGALLLTFLRRRTLGLRSPEIMLLAVAVLYTAALIYGLAIDPKARMFLPVGAIAAALVGHFAVATWDAGERAIAAVLLAALVLVGAVETAKRFELGSSRDLAAAWAQEHPGQVAVEDATRRFLTFDATVRALPVYPAGAKPRVIMLIAGQCAEARPVLHLSSDWLLARSAAYGRANDPLNLCEFANRSRYANRVVPPRT